MSDEQKEVKVEVSNITINIGDKKISLTLDEARRLKAALNELFPSPVTVIKETEVERPYRWEDRILKAVPDTPKHRQVVSIYSAFPMGSEVPPGYLELTTGTLSATVTNGVMNVDVKNGTGEEPK